jgi:uncharacterized protein YndB with AHSA1/START domain
MTEGDIIEVSIHVSAQPEIVFPYFTDPRRYVQWMGRDATLEAVPGGCYRVHIRDGIEAVGEFVEVDPPHRLVFTWGWTHDHEVPAGATRVVITLQAENGGTRVILRHYDLPDAGQRDHHRKGWKFYLDRLSARIRGEDPGPDPNT